MTNLKRRLVGALVALMATTTMVVALNTEPAEAADVGVYIVMPTWAGNCPGGGSVVRVTAQGYWGVNSSYAADWGDDIVWLKVGLNQSTQIIGNVQCLRTVKGKPMYYNGPAVSVDIRATRSGQAWYIGPNYASHN